MKNSFYFFVSMVCGLLVWQSAVTFLAVPEFLLPAPLTVLNELGSNFSYYAGHMSITLGTALTGFTLATVVSIVTAALFTTSRRVENFLWPYILILKTTPATALAPLLVLWFGLGFASKVTIVFLICFFPIFIGALKGFKTVDPELRHLFISLRARKIQLFTRLIFPYALPHIFPALKTTILYALTGAFIAEFIASQAGIGYLVLLSLRTFESADMYAAILLTSLVGMILFFIVSFIERTVVFWQKPQNF